MLWGGSEQGFPCVLILTGKNLFSLQGTPVLIAGILYSFRDFPVRIIVHWEIPVVICSGVLLIYQTCPGPKNPNMSSSLYLTTVFGLGTLFPPVHIYMKLVA